MGHKIGLFLGAGSSVPFDMPTTVSVRAQLLEKYKLNFDGALGNPRGLLYSFLENTKFADIEDVLQALTEWSDLSEERRHAITYLEGNGSVIQLNAPGRQTHYRIEDLVRN